MQFSGGNGQNNRFVPPLWGWLPLLEILDPSLLARLLRLISVLIQMLPERKLARNSEKKTNN